MKERDIELRLRTLSYLITVMLQRLQETDSAWARELMEGIKADREEASASGRTSDALMQVFDMTIAMLEEAFGKTG